MIYQPKPAGKAGKPKNKKEKFMKQYVYKERVYNDINTLYKENRKDNLVTLEQFKKNIESKMTIDEALIYRDLSEREKEREDVFSKSLYEYDFLLYLPLTALASLVLITSFNTVFLFNHDVSPIQYLYSLLGLVISAIYLPFPLYFIFRYFSKKEKLVRKRIKELDEIIKQEYKEIEAKIEEQLKLI